MKNETSEEDCHIQYRNLWHIITKDDNGYLTQLLKIGLDINKRDYNV